MEGKQRVRQNRVSHGLRAEPARVREDLTGDRRARFDELVRAIAEAEGVMDNPLDVEIVRDFVTAAIMLEGARDWMHARGFITADVWRRIPNETGGEVAVDTRGERIADPVIPESIVAAYNTLSRLKAKLHERLRAGTGGRGDGSPTGPQVVVRMWKPSSSTDEREAPP